MKRSGSVKKRRRTLTLAVVGLSFGAILTYALVAWRRALMPEIQMVPWGNGMSIYEVGEDASREWTGGDGAEELQGIADADGGELVERAVPLTAAADAAGAEAAAAVSGADRGDGGDEAGKPQRTRRSGLLEIEGIGPVYAETLAGHGLLTTEDLLATAGDPKGREELAAATGISKKLILRWVNQADLFRVKGVGEQYADLLEAAGVDTVPELAQRRADNLTKKMAQVNEKKKLVRRTPSETEVAGWIESAKGLPRVVTY